jgi:hypothetical protein
MAPPLNGAQPLSNRLATIDSHHTTGKYTIWCQKNKSMK